MAAEHDNARKKATGPGAQSPGREPAPSAAGEPEAPVAPVAGDRSRRAAKGAGAHPSAKSPDATAGAQGADARAHGADAQPRPGAGPSTSGPRTSGPSTSGPGAGPGRSTDSAAASGNRDPEVPASGNRDPGVPASGDGDARVPASGNGDPAVPASGNGDPGAAHATDPAQASPEDHERQLERDLEELSARAEKADEYLELARRTKADFENYRKRAARETAAAQDRGIVKLAKELLPAIDNLDRAVQAAETAVASEAEQSNGAATLVSGVKLVHADVLAALQRAGIERYSPQGEPFNPQRHEAIAQQPVDGAQPGTIVEVYQQGYLLGEAVIRPARVVVAG